MGNTEENLDALTLPVENASPDLQSLIRLQELDLTMRRLRKVVANLPDELENIERQREKEKDTLESSGDQLSESNKERRLFEAEVEDLRQTLSRYKVQLMEVKTNEAYQAMLHEIEYAEKLTATKEDAILEHMLAAEELQNKLNQAQQHFDAREKELASKKAELESSAKEAEEQLADVKEQIDRLKLSISTDLLSQYEKIASARNGIALAQLDGHSCQACHVRLRPQLIAEVRSNKHIIPCENCSRILYFPKS